MPNACRVSPFLFGIHFFVVQFSIADKKLEMTFQFFF